jgi:uncharacterized protein YbjT (DUF2867 family)
MYEMTDRTAIVFGATGLVGNLLLEELSVTGTYSLIKIFVRQITGISTPGTKEIVADFSNPESFLAEITGDDLFICLGTTIKKAGTVSNMEKIDRDLPAMLARNAYANGVKKIAVVSSLGANASSNNYYLRIKGEMENEILKAGFGTTIIVRPSMLLGERKERRTGEAVGKVIMKVVQPALTGKLRKFRAIHGRDVARAMVNLINTESGTRIMESDELQRAAYKG